MQKRTRIATFGVILLSSSILFTASTKTANAWFFDPFENMVETALNSIENIILGLSSDIGTMADRILVMSDNIGLMADRIGEMADRIVYTEELMLSAITDSGVSSLITSPTEGSIVSRTTPVIITLSSQKTDYLLYISNNADMSGATNALVQNSDTSIAWSRVTDFATGNKLYIAVKTVGGTTSSDFSNTVMLNLQ
ncbi:MAG: hypothetical protein OQK98_06895 [Gammaproteobacteria bacterium]|nr:hypothetical protein [Gammaproteobacteria bacterium]